MKSGCRVVRNDFSRGVLFQAKRGAVEVARSFHFTSLQAGSGFHGPEFYARKLCLKRFSRFDTLDTLGALQAGSEKRWQYPSVHFDVCPTDINITVTTLCFRPR